MKNPKFKVTPQAHKAIVAACKDLPALVRQNADGSPQYRKLATFKGASNFNTNNNSYTKNSAINLVPVLINHQVQMIAAYQQYGISAIQNYVDMVHEINNNSLQKTQ